MKDFVCPFSRKTLRTFGMRAITESAEVMALCLDGWGGMSGDRNIQKYSIINLYGWTTLSNVSAIKYK